MISEHHIGTEPEIHNQLQMTNLSAHRGSGEEIQRQSVTIWGGSWEISAVVCNHGSDLEQQT